MFQSVARRACVRTASPGLRSFAIKTTRPVNKIVGSAEEAVSVIKDGSKLCVPAVMGTDRRLRVCARRLVGGFGLCGIPEKLIAALEKQVCVIFTVSLLLLIARLVLVCVCGDGGIVMVVVVVRVCPFVCAC